MPVRPARTSALSKMVGNLLMLGFLEEETEEICWLAMEGRLGGVILFERNAKTAIQVASLAVRLREIPKEKRPILALDQEHGKVCRIKSGVTLFPSPRQLGLLESPKTTMNVARWTARELRRLGVNLNLAPTADVLEAEEVRPLLEERCFGDRPEKVAMHVAHWIRGSQEAGVAACVKHFPGHGSARGDTHLDAILDPSDASTIFHKHLVPFLEAFKEKVASVMVSHVIYPALDPWSPASLSSKIILGILRGRFGFKGLILTDDLEMGAVASNMDPVTAAAEAIKAGADMAIISRNLLPRVSPTEIVEGLEGAVAAGDLPQGRVEDSLGRVARFRMRWNKQVDEAPQEASLPGARRLAMRLWEELSRWEE